MQGLVGILCHGHGKFFSLSNSGSHDWCVGLLSQKYTRGFWILFRMPIQLLNVNKSDIFPFVLWRILLFGVYPYINFNEKMIDNIIVYNLSLLTNFTSMIQKDENFKQSFWHFSWKWKSIFVSVIYITSETRIIARTLVRANIALAFFIK